jgi:glycosyltransferase involved in cell wall biosynthesis
MTTQPSPLVVVCVPTINSSAFIEASLTRLFREIEGCQTGYTLEVLVCVSGARGAASTIAALERLQPRVSYLKMLREPRPGKNNAMNTTLRHLRARSLPPAFAFFFDDDVHLSPGTLRRNLDALVAHEATHGEGPVLVGAAMRALPLSWCEALRESDGCLLRALWLWQLYQIFAFPYLDESPVPRFCEGMALGARLEHFPALPDSETGIGDDTFLSNTFALLGRERFLRRGVHSLLKPTGSVGRVALPVGLKAWREQQLRVHIGIERSWRHFGAERDFLASYFSWPFAFNPDSRALYQPQRSLRAVRRWLYMRLHQQNYERALALMAQGHTPSWCVGEKDHASAR